MERFKYKDLEHMKEVVRNEIIRLGIQDDPKVQSYNDGYIRGKAPSPSLIFSKSKMTWIEFIEEIGFKSISRKESSETGKRNLGKKYAKVGKQAWKSDSFRKRIMDEAVTAMHEGGYGMQTELSKYFKNDIGIGFGTFLNHDFTYGDFIHAYVEKYGELPHGVRSAWKYATDKELITGMENLFKKYKCTSFWDYIQKNHDSLAPDAKLLMRRLGKKNVYVLANGFAAQYGKFGKSGSLNRNKGIGKRWA